MSSTLIHEFGEPHDGDFAFSRQSRKRRYLSRSEEEIASELDPKNLEYRAGWPDLPPLPLETTFQVSVPNSVDYRTHVAAIFSQHGMPMNTNDVKFAYRSPKGTHPDQMIEFLTLVIQRDYRRLSTGVSMAIVKSRQYLKATGIPDLETCLVEVIDPRAITNVKGVAMNAGHPMLNICDQMCQDVKELLSSSQEGGQQWSSLSILKRGIGDNVKLYKPTLVITSPTAGERSWWTSTVPAIKKLFNQKGYDLAVEVLWAANVFLNGTCGGQITVKNGSVVRSFGSTNGHVVVNERLSALTFVDGKPGALRPGNDKEGQKISGPALGDYEAMLKKKEQDVEKMKAINTKTAEVAMKRAWEDLGLIKNFNTDFGEVFAGSGTRICTKQGITFPLEWALIDLPERTIREKL
ncbi:hypothetical protein K491DRAFT_719060 [Lophiostoma macrostomum CBS 122681]|uniref:Uncharacterized protein n=1 Tax=Lophiostoma macrostomum CBS 122681 TaxID=1314788 RepID=A0A6A6SXI6_9PLEO|nr:hypothetical protein K491DRAFT_719060 [Lophiostoma macrostomum CBS 122681]